MGLLQNTMNPPPPPSSKPITAVRSREANVTLSGAARCGPEAPGLHGRRDSKIEKYTVQELNTKKAEGEKHFFFSSLFPKATERAKPYENR